MVDPVKVICRTADETKAMFPKVTEFADAIRKEFGNGVKLVYAEENGRCVGTRSVSDPDRTVKLSEIELDCVAEVKSGRRK